jgi:hypothetical protein
MVSVSRVGDPKGMPTVPSTTPKHPSNQRGVLPGPFSYLLLSTTENQSLHAFQGVAVLEIVFRGGKMVQKDLTTPACKGGYKVEIKERARNRTWR